MIFLTLILIAGIWNYRLISYGLLQLRGQLHIVSGSVEIEKVLTNPEVADSVKTKLIFIQKVRRFAFDSLGFKFSRNYTTYYDQKGKHSLWVVTAASPYKMEAYEWDFPFLGTVSYKGFFDYDLGLKEVQKLKEQNLDVDYGPTGGWSTLGWFRDPVLSGMLKRDYGDLANLIIHELTHETLFVPDSVQFNENLASFTGDKGAKMFLEKEFGKVAPEYKKYINNLHDDSLFNDFMVRSASKLDSLYQTFPEEMSVKEKEIAKVRKINEIIVALDTVQFNHPDRFRRYIKEASTAGNTLFLGFLRYGAKQADFETEFREQYKGSLKDFVAGYRERYPSL